MEKSQTEIYPSIKYFKIIVLLISIVLFVFSCLRTIVTLKEANNNINVDSVSSKIFSNNYNLTKFSENKVDVVKLDQPVENKHEEEISDNNVVIPVDRIEVFDGLTIDELTEKLNRSLPSTLSGTGYIFSNYTAKTGLDPYLAISIVLHETGCKWGCSDLVNTCYNVGGVKGAPGCYGGEYQAYSSLEEGITYFLYNLYYNYYSRGLTTAEAINPYYAESTSWASQVNSYIYQVRYT